MMIGVFLVLALLLYIDVLSSSLIILTMSAMWTVLLYKYMSLFKHSQWLYLIALLVSVATIIFSDAAIVSFIARGYVAYSIFVVVMMVGVLPNHWTVSRHIKKYRGVLSILGFILITPHAFLHVFGVLDGINLFGIAAYVLMVPLTIISFQFIKKEIPPKDWLTVQKAAYVIYASLFVHLLLVGEWFDKIIYAVLLVLYVNNKLYKEFHK